MVQRIRKIRGELTPKQSRFVEVFNTTGDATYAATKAGYKHPHVMGAVVKASANVAEALKAKQHANAIAALAMPKATQGLIKRMENPKASDRDYATLYTQLRNTADGIGSPSDHEKAIQDMTPEEVAAAIARLEAQAMAKARDVTPGPSSAFD